MIVLPSGVVTIEGLLGTLLEGLRTTGDPRSESKIDSMQGRQKEIAKETELWCLTIDPPNNFSPVSST